MKDIDKKVVKDGIDKATAEFTEKISFLGYIRTKKWFWVRESENSADFIHFHLNGISYGAPRNYSVSFRVHCGFRSYEDKFVALALNGPCSADIEASEKRYHHRFNAKSGSTYERCIDDLVRFVVEIGETWFKKQVIENVTLASSDPQLRQQSLKLLGLKSAKRNVLNKYSLQGLG
jgi:hypothetical protein